VIFNDHVLFIHAPKTAGMSVSHYLLSHLEGDIYITAPAGHEKENSGRVHVLEGMRHEWLHKAAEILKPHGRSVESFQRIISAIRNPYDLEVSRFHYLRLGHPYDAGYAQELALTGNFKEFCKSAPYVGRNPSNVAAWYILGQRLLPSMRIVRVENLERGLADALSGFVSGHVELPRINVTAHEPYERYIDAEVEEYIYRKYKWIFDTGFYPRHECPPQSAEKAVA